MEIMSFFSVGDNSGLSVGDNSGLLYSRIGRAYVMKALTNKSRCLEAKQKNCMPTCFRSCAREAHSPKIVGPSLAKLTSFCRRQPISSLVILMVRVGVRVKQISLTLGRLELTLAVNTSF